MPDQHRFMLVEEVAQEARVSLSTVHHWLRTGRLKSVRPGRRRMVARSDFEKFVASLPADIFRKGPVDGAS
jgi:excisionase family DNA binding protein